MTNIIKGISTSWSFFGKLLKSGRKYVMAKSTYGDFLSSGLNKQAILSIKPIGLHGSKMLRQIIASIVQNNHHLHRSNRSFQSLESLPMKSTEYPARNHCFLEPAKKRICKTFVWQPLGSYFVIIILQESRDFVFLWMDPESKFRWHVWQYTLYISLEAAKLGVWKIRCFPQSSEKNLTPEIRKNLIEVGSRAKIILLWRDNNLAKKQRNLNLSVYQKKWTQIFLKMK